jgi:putative transcriptional regulator
VKRQRTGAAKKPLALNRILHHRGEMRLQEYLTKTSTSRADFALQIGVSAETVRRYLSGQRFPDWSVVHKIVEATKGEVTANDFLKVAA